jgi:hypothetical protein
MDVAPSVTHGVRTANLLTGSGTSGDVKPAVITKKHQVAIVPVAAPPRPKAYTVEAIRGAKRTEEVVR